MTDVIDVTGGLDVGGGVGTDHKFDLLRVVDRHLASQYELRI